MEWQEVISFWFEKLTYKEWFGKSKEFDAQIRKKFSDIYGEIVQGEKDEWRNDAKGRLAEILVLDQFSRNMFRDTPEMFAHDCLALALSQEAIRAGADTKLSNTERLFLYLPFMHSESKKIQEKSLQLFTSLSIKEAEKYALEHKRIIDLFGRFPHRNAILGRTSTQEEIEFLKTHPGF